MTYDPDYDRVLPTLADPALITAADGKMFIVWVELVGKTHPERRWVFVSMTRVRYLGSAYRGEDSLEAIRALVDEWWTTKKALGQDYG